MDAVNFAVKCAHKSTEDVQEMVNPSGLMISKELLTFPIEL